MAARSAGGARAPCCQRTEGGWAGGRAASGRRVGGEWAVSQAPPHTPAAAPSTTSPPPPPPPPPLLHPFTLARRWKADMRLMWLQSGRRRSSSASTSRAEAHPQMWPVSCRCASLLLLLLLLLVVVEVLLCCCRCCCWVLMRLLGTCPATSAAAPVSAAAAPARCHAARLPVLPSALAWCGAAPLSGLPCSGSRAGWPAPRHAAPPPPFPSHRDQDGLQHPLLTRGVPGVLCAPAAPPAGPPPGRARGHASRAPALRAVQRCMHLETTATVLQG